MKNNTHQDIFGMSKEKALDRLYYDSIENLKILILSQYPSVKNFCENHDIDRWNLNKIFANSYHKEMSIGLYMRCLKSLGMIDSNCMTEEQLNLNVSLRSYLKIDNNMIMQTLMLLQF